MKSLIWKEREWKIAPLPDDALTREIEASLDCARPFAVLLARRGGKDWQGLIDPGFHNFHSPFDLSGMEAGISRLIEAITHRERLFIHGDFDVDGLTGAAVLYQGLLPLLPKGTIKVDVGDRGCGHGLSREFVHRVIKERFTLVITVDCGVSNAQEIDLLRESGIDTIVTDHHTPPRVLPPAITIIDPQCRGETYPNLDLAGVGVAYKLICALYERLDLPTPYHLLDLVALGTVADLVPLAKGGEVENRAMVREGLNLIARQEGSSLGLRVLMDKLSINTKKLTTSDIGYIIAPKLNAANRAGDPKVAFLLLTTGAPQRAEYLTEILLDYNRDREIAQDDLISQAEERMAEDGVDPKKDRIIILSGKYWNEGILGLAASNLTDRYGVPAIIISQGDSVSRASCRSVNGFNMVACLEAHSDLFLHYGGHQMAAGFSVSNEALPELRGRLLNYAAQQGLDYLASGMRLIDARVAAEDINVRFHTNIRSLAPYGPGNPAPLFLFKDCSFTGFSLVGARRQHLKGKVSQNGLLLPFIAFRMGKHIDTFKEAHGASLVAHAGFDDWQGSVQIEVVDLVRD
ncbi:TPA: single-stranded-DNA-specific exonuclease RecJ [Candidatus Acetothermia bacterium]|nr:single-stranded-DNA-specific exonuclease RecJ [Candidatus Acetothermia bacterium]